MQVLRFSRDRYQPKFHRSFADVQLKSKLHGQTSWKRVVELFNNHELNKGFGILLPFELQVTNARYDTRYS
jgi:hypothetical protein